jgi:MSHA biogenesis protein MshK
MSLINDALKRAGQSPAKPPGPAATAESMRLAEPHQSVGLPRYFFPILLCVLCGALWFIARGWDARRRSVAIEPDVVRVQAREAEPATGVVVDPNPNANALAAASAPQNPTTPSNGAIPAHRNFSLNDDQATPASASAIPDSVDAVPAASSITAPAEPPAQTVQIIRLQGIFYRTAGASAVINSQTVYVGDHVAGARVKAIQRGSVTLERDGQTQVLTLR